MKPIQLPTIHFVKLFRRFHLTFFIIFIALILSGTVLLINNVILNPEDAANSSEAGSTVSGSEFSAMQRLHMSNELKTPPTVSTKRVSPFSE